MASSLSTLAFLSPSMASASPPSIAHGGKTYRRQWRMGYSAAVAPRLYCLHRCASGTSGWGGAPPPPSSLPRQRRSGHGGNLLTHVVLQQDRVAPFSLKWLDLAEALLLVIDLVVQRPDPLTTFLLVENPVVQQPDLCGNTPPGGESGGGLAESCSAAPPGGGSARSSGGAAVMDGLVVGLRNGLTSSQ